MMTRFERIKAIADDIQDQEPGSRTFTRRELVRVLTHRVQGARNKLGHDPVYKYESGDIDRRQFLKFIGLAGATGFAATTGLYFLDQYPNQSPSGMATASCDYKTVTSGRNIGDGETVSNLLVDQSSGAAKFNIITNNASTTVVKNIGFTGKPGGSSWHSFQLLAQARHPDGKIIIENIYMGDKGPSTYWGGGIFVHEKHAGDILFKNVNIQYFGNNGLYAAGPGYDGQLTPAHGTVRIENSFSKSNNISNYRIGSDGSYVKDSVSYAPGDAPHAGSAYQERAHWAEFHTTKVMNCDMKGLIVCEPAKPYTGPDPVCKISDSRLSGKQEGLRGGTIKKTNCTSNPNLAVPKGVPTSPQEAACGTSSATGSPSSGGSKSNGTDTTGSGTGVSGTSNPC